MAAEGNDVAISIPEPTLPYCLRNKHRLNLNQNAQVLVHENAFENIICEMASILTRGRWFKKCLINLTWNPLWIISMKIKFSFKQKPSNKNRIKKQKYRIALSRLHASSHTVETRTTRTPAFWEYLHRPMTTHIIDSYQIPSQNKTKSKLQIWKICQKFKF